MRALPVIRTALDAAVRDLGVEEPPDPELIRARNPEHGDYSSSVAMKLARPLRQSPPQIAARLAQRLELEPASVEAVGGYLNFRLRTPWLQALVRSAAADEGYGSSQIGAGERLQVEFVSTNPTGPLHIGHGRGAILGDVLCRLLDFTGHRTEREYYVNDYGSQARKFGASLLARMRGEEPPEGGYAGDYVIELADAARRDLPGVEARPEPEAVAALAEYGSARMVERFQATLARIGVRYDRWFSERSLWERGTAPAAIERLRQQGYLKQAEGAVWFAPGGEETGEDVEDRVIFRRDGSHTYFASDIGYLVDRFLERGYRRVIEVWGADHHGYVPRMKAVAQALGIDPDRLVVILMQMVTLKEGRMSKREGRFVGLDELVDRVGVDAVRYFYLLRSPEAPMEFDLELATAQRSENPVYYAQYAHARLFNVERTAAETHPALPAHADVSLLQLPWELALARQVSFWPDVVEQAARLLEPHRLPYYVHQLAEAVHTFYQAGNEDPALRVVVPDPGLTRARLELCRAARNTLRLALGLMGVAAPERM
jgi:arginyl-tRNA synthetase